MALIIRIDVDRPYGKTPFLRHVLSRVSADLYFPKVASFGYLRELEVLLQLLNEAHARSYIFFRRCTLPSKPVLQLIDAGRHEIGLHLENSRSLEAFRNEKSILESYIGDRVLAISKHGSGKNKYGFHHYAPYEPENYIRWAQDCGMNLFLGNLEDPTLPPSKPKGDLRVYPSAFWLEPSWRDTEKFTIDWLVAQATARDIVLLMHPDNVLADPAILSDLKTLLRSLETKILQ